MYKFKSIFRFQVFLLVLALPLFLCARQINTFYGSIDVEEPILLELIDSPSFQRLAHIHQYGVSYYITHKEEYNRYDHSIGVFAILRTKGASLEAQIAGLLHDVSHTAFSHVGDWIFDKQNQEQDYQNSIHSSYLEKSGLGIILNKYGLIIDQILPKEELFPELENSLPNLSADRIDYNIQGAFYQGFITYEEALLIYQDIHFVDNRWVSTQPDLMKKITLFSLFMTLNCWGSPTNYLLSRWLADAILRGFEIGCISYTDLHFGTDQIIWDILIKQNDSIIAEKMKMVLNHQLYFSIINCTEEADFIVKSKFRAIDPWIRTDFTYSRLTSIDKNLAEEYERIGQIIKQGWAIKIHSSD